MFSLADLVKGLSFLLFVGAMGYSVIFFYVQEYAPICSMTFAEDTIYSNRKCSCQGIELTRRNDLETDGILETVCLGKVEEVECYVWEGVERFEVECE